MQRKKRVGTKEGGYAWRGTCLGRVRGTTCRPASISTWIPKTRNSHTKIVTIIKIAFSNRRHLSTTPRLWKARKKKQVKIAQIPQLPPWWRVRGWIHRRWRRRTLGEDPWLLFWLGEVPTTTRSCAHRSWAPTAARDRTTWRPRPRYQHKRERLGTRA